jgi:hypothetical protein
MNIKAEHVRLSKPFLFFWLYPITWLLTNQGTCGDHAKHTVVSHVGVQSFAAIVKRRVLRASIVIVSHPVLIGAKPMQFVAVSHKQVREHHDRPPTHRDTAAAKMYRLSLSQGTTVGA